MNKSDFSDFQQMLSACLSMWDAAPRPEVIAMWFRALSKYDLPTVAAGFNAHVCDPINGKFAPKPAHIIEQIEGAHRDDGRPGPEEAWALSLKARDEYDTVVWTHECVQAWAVAKPVMDLGDDVGARMAFREAYTRLVDEARARREPIAWEVSEGFDKERRRIAVAEAVEAGRIAPGHYLALTQPTELLAIGMDHQESQHGIPPSIRERLQQLRDSFAAQYDGPSQADYERERTAELKRQQQAKIDAYLKQCGPSAAQ